MHYASWSAAVISVICRFTWMNNVTQSARGQAQSKTLSRGMEAIECTARLGVRQSSAALRQEQRKSSANLESLPVWKPMNTQLLYRGYEPWRWHFSFGMGQALNHWELNHCRLQVPSDAKK
jgi:hypothetical protein